MYDTIKLEKSMYNLTGKSFSQALEELDRRGYAEYTGFRVREYRL